MGFVEFGLGGLVVEVVPAVLVVAGFGVGCHGRNIGGDCAVPNGRSECIFGVIIGT